jgi:ribosome-associated heat shock protein Hsp15
MASPSSTETQASEVQRLDHWLWCARFFKTRSLAAEQASLGRVQVNGLDAKPGKSLRPGDTVRIRQSASVVVECEVLTLARTRGSATIAAALYRETASSVQAREAAREQRKLAPEPALTHLQGRPTKRDRRQIGQEQSRWQRWSASIDDE